MLVFLYRKNRYVHIQYIVYNYSSLIYYFQEGTPTNDQHFFRRFSEKINSTALVHFFGILLLALALASPPAAAAEWTVGSDGCNFTTIGAALSNTSVTAGDVILVHQGTYAETVYVSKPLTLRGDAGATVNGGITITAAGAKVEDLTVNGAAGSKTIEVRASDAVVRGCTVSGGETGISIESATNCTVEECTLDDTITFIGIALSGSGKCQILDNTVNGSGGFGIGFMGNSPDCIISGNSVQDCDSAGIQLQSGCQGSVVVANILSNNPYGIVVMGCTGKTTVLRDNTIVGARDKGVSLSSGMDSLIVENVTVKGGEYGVELSSVDNITLANSTITGTGTGLSVESTTTDSLIANNLFNNTKNIEVRASTTMTGTRWNTTKTAGENIRGGSFLGGNLWLTPDGTGFSETRADFDLDGICDEAYVITDGYGTVVGTDYLPLQNGGPSANFTVASPIFMPGVSVSFNDTSVGTPTSWSWTFGDETLTTRNVTRTYDTAGTYLANLTVANAFGTNTTGRTVTVEPFSIQGAVDAASGGDVVLVPSGTYDEDVTVDKRITLRGSEGAMVNGKISLINTATGATVEHLAVNGVAGFSTITVNADDAVVRECTISGGQKGIDLYSAENCTVERCSVGGATDGISLYSMGQSRILDNQVTGCGCFGIVLIRDCPDCIISGNSVQNCNSSGIQLQSGCQGSVVESNTCSHNNNGITVTGCAGTTTVVRDNIIIEDRNIAVNLQSGDSVIVENVTAKDGNYGVSLIDVENITITNSAFTGFTRYGLYVPIGSSAPHSLIANNLFNNSENFYLSSSADLSNIRWNTTKTLGKNIRGGPFLGGNLWLTPAVTGFSETHADFDGDGICDEGYAITDDNGDVVGTDSLPLQNGGPSANFSVTSPTFMVGMPISFNDTSVGAPTSWSWDFGDETETAQNVTRTYDVVGTYQATLTVENEFGTNTTSRTLDVVPYTIQGAVNAASEGDVVLVPSGTYNEDVTVDKCLTLRGSEGAALNGEIEITADGATVENLTVNGVVGSTVITVNAADAVVRGCTIWDGGDGIRITSAPNCTVEGCTLGGTLTGNGIYLYSAGQSRILDNQMTGCGGFGIILYSSCPGCFISGNTVQDCKERGIQLQSGCQGSVVISNTCSGNNGGLKVSGCEGQTTILRDNTLLENNYYGVSLEKADSVIVENVTVKDGTSGISLTNVENITLTNSTFTGLTSCGLSVYPCYSATNSLIANNLFNNTWNVYIPDTSELTGTRWNTTKTFGKNIRGGPFLGGNLWLTPEGIGFSETHEDLNGDGICDEGYDLGNGCIDSLPLHTCLPTADFIFAPTGGSTPLTVQFTETCSGVNPRLYHWDFGDNTPAVEFVHPSHTFTTNGTHQVSLTVENAFGSDTTTKTVTALEPPTANFTVTPAGGKAPLTVVCTDASTGCVFARLWDFGDGTTSTEPTPIHVYAKAGTYTVSLNVSNPYASDMMVQEKCITVEAPAKSGGGGGVRSPASAGAASHIPAGGHASFGVRDAAITEVEVTAAESVSHILVTVEPTAKPNRIEAPAAAVYEYDEVTLYHTTDKALAGADLDFTVTKAWLEAQGAGPDDVVLYRYHDDAWHALLTRMVGEDEHRYSFTAESPGFSLFAIGVDESPAPAPTLTPVETVTPFPVTTAPPTPTPTQSPVPFGLAALAAAAALLLKGRRG